MVPFISLNNGGKNGGNRFIISCFLQAATIGEPNFMQVWILKMLPDHQGFCGAFLPD